MDRLANDLNELLSACVNSLSGNEMTLAAVEELLDEVVQNFNIEKFGYGEEEIEGSDCDLFNSLVAKDTLAQYKELLRKNIKKI